MDSSLATAYLRWVFIRAALARGWWLTTAVYLVTVADLSPAQLVLIGVFQGLTVVLAEVPAGVLADTSSRRLALVVAHVVMGSRMALTGFVTEYPLIVLSQCLWGLGWAISSGADVAWITDELDRPDAIDRVLTAQGRRTRLEPRMHTLVPLRGVTPARNRPEAGRGCAFAAPAVCGAPGQSGRGRWHLGGPAHR